MKELFSDILGIEDVKGVILFSLDGKVLFSEFISSQYFNPEERDWGPFIKILAGIREADFSFEKCRFYFRGTSSHFLMVIMDIFAPVSMVRLNCDLLLPSLNQTAKSKGLGQFFKRKK
ncbi:MAG: hypothetical protein JXA35_01685 [Deltaproteobacteria bacterium]|nr:hypothetical protein [Deltaproteobacteria bacterium]